MYFKIKAQHEGWLLLFLWKIDLGTDTKAESNRNVHNVLIFSQFSYEQKKKTLPIIKN